MYSSPLGNESMAQCVPCPWDALASEEVLIINVYKYYFSHMSRFQRLTSVIWYSRKYETFTISIYVGGKHNIYKYHTFVGLTSSDGGGTSAVYAAHVSLALETG